MEWKKINSTNSANVRYGHTAVLFEKKLYVFGGKTRDNNYIYSADLEIFSMEEKIWSIPIVQTKNTLKLRSFHTAEIIGIQ